MVKKNYYEGLDGLRAIAFLLVFFFHAGVPFFKLGWAGVNLFFVLSGFLITEILLETRRGQSNYFKIFYSRRLLRIFPLYYLLILVPIIYNLFALGSFPKVAWYSLLYLQNFDFSLYSSAPYFSWIAHTWTLCIEEQFYIFWPLLVFFLPTRGLLLSSLALIVSAVLYRAYFSDFTMIFGQLDSLALGGVLAILKFEQRSDLVKKTMKTMAILGLVLLFAILTFLGHTADVNLLEVLDGIGEEIAFMNTPFSTLIFTAVAFLSYSIISFTISYSNSYFHRIMSSFAFSQSGKISYGLYVYHYPVLYALRIYVSENVWVLCFLGLSITYIISYLSFVFFESYFIRLKSKFSYA